MSTNLLNYSGLLTKVHALERNLISDSDLEKIASLETTADFVNFLKENPAYSMLLEDYDEHQLHRGEIEHLLSESTSLAYCKLYRFANQEQRKALELVFFKYEMELIKLYLQKIFTKETPNQILHFEEFFTKHSDINIEQLASASTLDEFILHLQGSEYYDLFQKLKAMNHTALHEYETNLDIYYFTKVWKLKDRLLHGKNLKAATMIYGTQIDLLNILQIFRSKQYYDMESTQILVNIIPISYRLKRAELTKLADAVSVDEFFKILKTTFYSFSLEPGNYAGLEQLCQNAYKKIYKVCTFKYPTSMAPVYQYIYRKEQELDVLTTALECIRYSLDSTTILNYIKPAI